MTETRLWFITGISSGLGRALAQAALAAGDRVVGTFRKADETAAFEGSAPGRAFACVLDVVDHAGVEAAVERAERELGGIDVLVNNAGFGLEGTIEESSLAEMRHQFDVNVFGAVAVIKAALPHMRKRRRGHIVNVTSMGGLTTFIGLGFYQASKFALEGLSETLAKEVKGFGIHVTAVAPGGLRTDWAGRSLMRTPRSVDDYDALVGPVYAARAARNGQQIGDPARAALAILAIVDSARPPVHFLLGSDAVRFVGEKLTDLQAELTEWQRLSLSSDYPVDPRVDGG
jgi:NAD(P)-dependent dehydrogenase (short-subunit alcohol dehydrogenase family)